MPQYKYLVTRELTATIVIVAANVTESAEKVQDMANAMSNSEFDSRGDETAELLKAPEGEEVQPEHFSIIMW